MIERQARNVVRRITHVDGIEVIHQQEAYGTHPRYRERQVVISGVLHLILANEKELYACAQCGNTQPTVQQVVAHMGSHTPRDPVYPMETLKAVLRAVKRAQQNGHRNYCEVAANELNDRRVKTLDGEKWYAAQVSRIHRAYSDKIAVRVAPAQRAPSEPKTEPVKALVEAAIKPVETEASSPLVARLIAFGEKLSDLTTEYEALAGDITAELAERFDPEILEKAKKYDQLRSLLP